MYCLHPIKTYVKTSWALKSTYKNNMFSTQPACRGDCIIAGALGYAVQVCGVNGGTSWGLIRFTLRHLHKIIIKWSLNVRIKYIKHTSLSSATFKLNRMLALSGQSWNVHSSSCMFRPCQPTHCPERDLAELSTFVSRQFRRWVIPIIYGRNTWSWKVTTKHIFKFTSITGWT